MKERLPRHWPARELVLIGVFAAAAKLSSLLIALAGGGMNPISLVAKNLVFTTLLIVLLTKIPKRWTLLLFTAVSMMISVLLLGGSLTLLPAALVGAIAGEAAVFLTGGAGKSGRPGSPRASMTSRRRPSRSGFRFCSCARARPS